MRIDTRSEFFPVFAAGTTNLPLWAASGVSLAHTSTVEHIDPVRTMDVAGIPNFFDHAGNFVNGHVAAMITSVSTGEPPAPLAIASRCRTAFGVSLVLVLVAS